MNNIDAEIIREDLEFIKEYIDEIFDRHPELNTYDDDDIWTKFDRRIIDIKNRLGA